MSKRSYIAVLMFVVFSWTMASASETSQPAIEGTGSPNRDTAGEVSIGSDLISTSEGRETLLDGGWPGQDEVVPQLTDELLLNADVTLSEIVWPLFEDPTVVVRGQNPPPESLPPSRLESSGATFDSRQFAIPLSPLNSLNIEFAVRGEFATRATTDVPSILNSPSVPSSGRTQRTPIYHDPRVRGSRLGRLIPRGSYWVPARADLDTMLSQIDSRLIESVVVTKGPYTALNGPGFDFIDAQLLSAPRYEDGYESHGSSSIEYKTNGEQWYGRQSFWGGSYDWGFRVGYGHRTGSDYEDPNGVSVPSSYNSRMPDLALSADLTDDSRIDFHYMRLDQTDVEFPYLAFDIDFLVTDAYEVKYTLEDQDYFDHLSFETWYNRTRFAGKDSNRKRELVPGLRLIDRGSTDVDSLSTGFQLALTWGDPSSRQVTTGVDLRYVKQRLNELTTFSIIELNFPIPQSHQSNPGIFLELIESPTDQLVFRAGTRLDWVSANADETVPTDPNENLETVLGGEFDQNFLLWSGFLTGEYEVDSHQTIHVGCGTAMRAPTMTELYADQTFLAVIPQRPFYYLFGNPTLDPERLWQIDAGLRGTYCHVRYGLNVFHAWVQDYITFDNLTGNLATPEITFVNTHLATLVGGESYLELDLTSMFTSFATVSYIEGSDRTRRSSNSPRRTTGDRSGMAIDKESLPTIAPLESRIGLRIHEAVSDPNWAIELSARVVDDQSRTAETLGEKSTPGFATLDLRTYQQREHLLITFGVENLTDRTYREHFDPRPATDGGNFFQPGVNFYFATELSY